MSDDDADSIILRVTSGEGTVEGLLRQDVERECHGLRDRLEESESRRRYLEQVFLDLLQRDLERSQDVAMLEELLGRLRGQLLLDGHPPELHDRMIIHLRRQFEAEVTPTSRPLALGGFIFTNDNLLSPPSSDQSSHPQGQHSNHHRHAPSSSSHAAPPAAAAAPSAVASPSSPPSSPVDSLHNVSNNAPDGINVSVPRAPDEHDDDRGESDDLLLVAEHDEHVPFVTLPVEAITDRAETPSVIVEACPPRSETPESPLSRTARQRQREQQHRDNNNDPRHPPHLVEHDLFINNNSFVNPERQVHFVADDVEAIAVEEFFYDPVHQRDFDETVMSPSASGLVSPTFIRHSHDADSYAMVSVPQQLQLDSQQQQQQQQQRPRPSSLFIPTPVSASPTTFFRESPRNNSMGMCASVQTTETCEIGVGTDDNLLQPQPAATNTTATSPIARQRGRSVDTAVGPATPTISELSSIAENDDDVAPAPAPPPRRASTTSPPASKPAPKPKSAASPRKVAALPPPSAKKKKSVASSSSPPAAPPPSSRRSKLSTTAPASPKVQPKVQPKRPVVQAANPVCWMGAAKAASISVVRRRDDSDDDSSAPRQQQQQQHLNMTPSRAMILRLRQQREQLAEARRRRVNSSSSSDSTGPDLSINRPRRDSLINNHPWDRDPRLTVPPKFEAKPPVQTSLGLFVDPMLTPIPSLLSSVNDAFASPARGRRRSVSITQHSTSHHHPDTDSPPPTEQQRSRSNSLLTAFVAFSSPPSTREEASPVAASASAAAAAAAASESAAPAAESSPNRGAMPPPRAKSPQAHGARRVSIKPGVKEQQQQQQQQQPRSESRRVVEDSPAPSAPISQQQQKHQQHPHRHHHHAPKHACKQCGHHCLSSARFCAFCGAKAVTSAASSSAPSEVA